MGVKEVLETRAHRKEEPWYAGKGMFEFKNTLAKTFGGAEEIDSDMLLRIYDSWAEHADEWGYGDTSPDSFLNWLQKPSTGAKKFMPKYKPKAGAADQFKTVFGVREDVGKAQREYRQPEKIDFTTSKRRPLR